MWMGIDRDTFYDASRIAIVPMGFCFPGLDDRKADLPPRPECRKKWHDRLMAAMPQIETVLVIGNYARDYHFSRAGLDHQRKLSLPEAFAASMTTHNSNRAYSCCRIHPGATAAG